MSHVPTMLKSGRSVFEEYPLSGSLLEDNASIAGVLKMMSFTYGVMTS